MQNLRISFDSRVAVIPHRRPSLDAGLDKRGAEDQAADAELDKWGAEDRAADAGSISGAQKTGRQALGLMGGTEKVEDDLDGVEGLDGNLDE